MDRSLSKQQLHETLREMRVRYPADASLEDLRQILVRENHRIWLEQVHRQHERGNRVIRRRKRSPVAETAESTIPGEAAPKPQSPLLNGEYRASSSVDKNGNVTQTFVWTKTPRDKEPH